MPLVTPDISKVRQLIPPLSSNLHKGQAGRIGVVGGSEDYTGAPYFSGLAAMKVGADLCHIFCEPGAGAVIKTYSPDLIVHPYMRTKEKNETQLTAEAISNRISDVFSRLHVLVVGPGLSRDVLMQDTAKKLIQAARDKDMAIVIDADGLFLVQNHPETVEGYRKAVLTPNVVEFQRLCKAKNIPCEEGEKDAVAEKLSMAFGGVTIVQKGKEDIISNGSQALKCDTPGGLKRMGGQGDILSGTIATFLAWGKSYTEHVWDHKDEVDSKDVSMFATWAACHTVRDSSKRAFDKYGRAVLTSHMLEELGASYAKLTENMS